MKNQVKLSFRALTIASSAVLALACGSSDNKSGGDTSKDSTAPQLDLPTKDADCAANPYLQDCAAPAPAPAPAPKPGATGTTAPTPAPATKPTGTAADLAKEAALNVLRTECGGCHGPQGNNSGGMNYIDDIDKLVLNNKIVPLDSANSFIIKRMSEGSMPPAPLAKVPDQQIDIVKSYIDNPAFWPTIPAAAGCQNSDQLFNYDDLYTEIQQDLAKADAEDAVFYRYLAITNRFDAGICDDTAMDRDRQAISKTINMLSTNAKLTAPLAIDKAQMIYRIDLRDYNFDKAVSINGQAFADKWEAILNFNKFAVEFTGTQADQAKQDAATTIPVMMSDSFIDAATIGNVYYGLIEVDVNQSINDFVLNVLGVDVVQNLADKKQARAGTTKSRISRQDRLVERDDIEVRNGALWQSFDFEDDANQSIFQDPFNFVAGGSEAIFQLPNNLMAFLIADANGALVEDSDILLDTTQNNFRAVTSVSCSGCHAGGFQPVVDEVGPSSIRNAVALGLNRDEVEQLQEIYLPTAQFQELVTSDSESYQGSLDRLKLPTKGGDPTSGIFLQFDKDLDLATVAGDLGITPKQLRTDIRLLNPAVQVVENSVIDRDDFTTFFVNSLCIMNAGNENAPLQAVCDAAQADVDALLQ